jgi:hypothetical protein
MSIDELSPSNPIRAQACSLLRDPEIEITIWGDGELKSEHHFEAVQHRLSPAAQAFKAYAMRAASLTTTPAPTETFRNCESWYPLDHGVDLHRVIRSSSS